MTDKSKTSDQPAFPVQGHFYDDKLIGQLYHGMTLRDYFAAKAMQGLLASPSVANDGMQIVRDSWAMADAMVRAREAK